MKKILIFSNYKARELDYLILLQKTLAKTLSAKVSIVGGLGEIQRMYYYLYKIKPDIVFIPQTLEKGCRDLAKYVLDSGALLYVVPAEITVIPAIEDLLLNPDITYNTYFTKIFIPGKRYEKLLAKTDISPKKIKITGSPKIDFLVRNKGGQFFSRKEFSKKVNTNLKKKNIFFFTSFVTISEEYLRTDNYFSKAIKQLMKSNTCVALTKQKYIEIIQKLCERLPHYNIIVKPHPLESSLAYKKITASNFILLEQYSLYNCIKSVDMAIHWSSTVSSECWIKGIKTIQLAPYKEYDSFLTECSPGNPIVRTLDELQDIIEKNLDKKREKKYKEFQSKYLRENYYRLDGKSVDRIASYLKQDISKCKIQTTYQPKFSWLVYPILFLEKTLGVPVSRRIVALFLKSYDAKAAISDYVVLE
ncbi:MAG: hypothetical protein BroJett025_04930 [Patescibacteria group bacterium]|nr:MAG: hypothetical protein BroJett025_04930 [Patescibacteria group bacterium]